MFFLEEEAGAVTVAAALVGMTLEFAGRFSIFCPVINLFSLSCFRYFVTVLLLQMT
jgi:hypothetical protein